MVPIELSRLTFQFLDAAETNVLNVEVSGKKKREIGLVVPGEYVTRSDSGKMARVLYDKLQEIKEKCSHFEWSFEKNETQNCKLPVEINK